MKKILFSLVALVCSMSMNAQVMKVMKNGEVVATYNGAEYTVVFEEEPAVQPYSVTFNKWMGDFTVSGNDNKKLIASNDDVTVELVLSSSGPGMPPTWDDGDVDGGENGGKLTVTVTAKATGVTITGIAIDGSSNDVTKTGSGPYEFTLGTGFAMDRFYDGDTKIGSINRLTVNYTK